MKMSFRTWLSVVTAVLILILLILSRHELAAAWKLMSQVNLWILALILPLIALNYFSTGEMIYSYLRSKGRIADVSKFTLMRMSLEVNFVNHVLPSGGASGVSYMSWRLGKFGVPAGRATMAQAVRFVAGFGAFTALLIVAVLFVTIDAGVNRVIILLSSALVTSMLAITVAGIYFLSDIRRVRKISTPLSDVINMTVRKLTFGKRQTVIHETKVLTFLEEMHDDFLELKRDKRVLIKPFLWAIAFTASDIGMYFVTFWALGTIVNPAPILIAYGAATIAGFAVVTPGGSGAYEALMVTILAVAGLNQGEAIAGVVLARVIILLTILIFGYIFYQNALAKQGKHDRPDLQR
ncbi:MAG TPA: lysylphosphatidylglycerol synthase transmembrane domain-containing protein [Patescibacteria group bacterium]|nr:lysylphosphatidylglycerol synthase transmembrane domain-containing protein [Patescibacteria group bacterium]